MHVSVNGQCVKDPVSLIMLSGDVDDKQTVGIVFDLLSWNNSSIVEADNGLMQTLNHDNR